VLFQLWCVVMAILMCSHYKLMYLQGRLKWGVWLDDSDKIKYNISINSEIWMPVWVPVTWNHYI
jgi:hypothetical protein